MKTRIAPICSLISCVLIGTVPQVHGQDAQAQCLVLAQHYSKPSAWNDIINYFKTLRIDIFATERSHLLSLRGRIIELEIQKIHLIDIVERHYNGNLRGEDVSDQLRLTSIPIILAQIDTISTNLVSIVKAGNLFVAEDAFRDLKVNLDERKAVTLCRIAQETASPAPNRAKMLDLIENLRSELEAIRTANETLAKYIRESGG